MIVNQSSVFEKVNFCIRKEVWNALCLLVFVHQFHPNSRRIWSCRAVGQLARLCMCSVDGQQAPGCLSTTSFSFTFSREIFVLGGLQNMMGEKGRLQQLRLGLLLLFVSSELQYKGACAIIFFV